MTQQINVREKTVYWRRDLQAIIGAVLMGVIFVLVQQVTLRIDAILDPALNIINGTTWAVFTGLIVLIYRQPAGIITGEIQALVTLITGASPLAIAFVFANGLASIAYSIVAHFMNMEKWIGHFVAQLATNVVGNACVCIGLIVVFNLPVNVAIIASLITAGACTVASTVITKLLAGRLRKLIVEKNKAFVKKEN